MKCLNITLAAVAQQLPDLRIKNPSFISKKANNAQVNIYEHGTPRIFCELPAGGDKFQYEGEMNLKELDCTGTASQILIINGV